MRIDEVYPEAWEASRRKTKNLTLEQKIAYWRRSDRPALIESIKNSDAGLNFVAELAFASDQLKFEDGSGYYFPNIVHIQGDQWGASISEVLGFAEYCRDYARENLDALLKGEVA